MIKDLGLIVLAIIFIVGAFKIFREEMTTLNVKLSNSCFLLGASMLFFISSKYVGMINNVIAKSWANGSMIISITLFTIMILSLIFVKNFYYVEKFLVYFSKKEK